MTPLTISSWQMYTDKGNQAVNRMMYFLHHLMQSAPLPHVRSKLHQHVRILAKTHPEVYDTEPLDAIAHQLSLWASEIHQLPTSTVSTSYWNL